ncbi:MAG: twin-arginine translocase subunit TatC [Chloroflexi bacterium]|nr:twin-arginine translocase subunit TatC [Chloroflexota bacterium]MCC6896945.1 twin-arginine translocase subunit TatC [Anaerolineae bacterium]
MQLQRGSAPAPEIEPAEAVGDGEGAAMSLWDHLDELRSRLFKAILALVLGTLVGVAIATPVLEFLIQPYGRALVVLDPTGGVVQYFRVALLVGGILSIPMITYQLLAFILPGLTSREKRILVLSIPPVTLLFLVGVVFAWFILIPPALDFLVNFQTDIFRAEWTSDRYLGFVTSLLFWMGVAFETPLVFFVLSILGFVTPRPLIQNWRIAIVGAAIAAAIITPTVDPVNMGLVMGPLLALYLLSILLVWIGMRFNRPVPEG